jgi:ABC-type methionine transport system ATPase subunit
MKKALDLIFPQELIKKPVIHQMAKQFDVVFNLRRAKVTETTGEIVLELEGEKAVLDKAVEWLKKQGLRVEPITHDTLES